METAAREVSAYRRPWALGIGMMAAFAMVLLVGGYGMGPIGMMLFLGWQGWTLPNLPFLACLIGWVVAVWPGKDAPIQ